MIPIKFLGSDMSFRQSVAPLLWHSVLCKGPALPLEGSLSMSAVFSTAQLSAIMLPILHWCFAGRRLRESDDIASVSRMTKDKDKHTAAAFGPP